MMADLFEQFYAKLSPKEKHLLHVLALSPDPITVLELAKIGKIRESITNRNVVSLMQKAIEMYFVTQIFQDAYNLKPDWVVRIFPNLTGYEKEKEAIKRIPLKISRYYYNPSNKQILNYLNALFYNDKELLSYEDELYKSKIEHNLSEIDNQPLYKPVYDRLSIRVLNTIFNQKAVQVFKKLDSLAILNQTALKYRDKNSDDINLYQGLIAYKEGKWEKATSAFDSAIACYSEATFSFMKGDIGRALKFFDKGMTKERQYNKHAYLPDIPEAALFYLVALSFSDDQDAFMTAMKKITDLKSQTYSDPLQLISSLCHALTSRTAHHHSDRFKKIEITDTVETILWKIIALGFTGENPTEPKAYMEKGLEVVKIANKNGYLPAAYEAAYCLQTLGSKEAGLIFSQLSAKLEYPAVLSKLTRTLAWEKEIQAYLSLEAVKLLIRQENEAGKSRVAYRFFPQGHAYPFLQTRLTGGAWSSGKNIPLNQFKPSLVDCMTEQDKRIAAAISNFSSVINRHAIAEMIGHPYVFLENSNLAVELIAARPMLSVVKTSQGNYKLTSDLTHLGDTVYIEKETNTRYKVYSIDKNQREILMAVKNGKEIPEQGKEKLLKIIEYFSAYITVHTELTDNEKVRQVEADARLRIQLLPFGEGLKAELFVKPFGDQPPYCKPGKGGKVLIIRQDKERLQVVRDLQAETQHEETILSDVQTIEGFEMQDGVMIFDSPHDILELLEILRKYSEIVIVEWPEGERLSVRGTATFDQLKLQIKSGINWFELDGELQLDDRTVIAFDRLLEMVRRGRGRFIELAEGEFIALSQQFKRRLSELQSFSTISKNKVVINRFATAALPDVFDDFEHLQTDEEWTVFRKQLQEATATDLPVPANLKAELRPYQEEGYRWMTRLAVWGAGACLADDMGLGKTVQAIAIMLQRASLGPALVVAPVSVLSNWMNEVNRFAPSLFVKTLHTGDRAETFASLSAGDLLVTSYGLLQSEEEAFTAIEWATVTLDEAHVIKNYTTKTSKAAMMLKAEFRIILTGTPIQNHLGEMWNLFRFINPGLLGELSDFTENYIKPADQETRKRLKKLISPFMLRRTKTAVLDELPPKTEIIRKIVLSEEEMAFYEVLRRRAIETIQNDDSPQGARHLKALAEITRLRQACCNLKLVEPKTKIKSTKLSVFLEIVAELKENGHRPLVFSQFVTHLTIVRKALDKQGFSYEYLDGSTPPAKREVAVRNFQAGQCDLFLISLKAGGLGLNLTAADFVIHLDPWWNPAVEDQASDRAHRIGQSRPVTVYRLVTEHTIEEKIIRLHSTKRDLADSLLEGSDQPAKLSMQELMELIRHQT